jgi:hypothetical protein
MNAYLLGVRKHIDGEVGPLVPFSLFQYDNIVNRGREHQRRRGQRDGQKDVIVVHSYIHHIRAGNLVFVNIDT